MEWPLRIAILLLFLAELCAAAPDKAAPTYAAATAATLLAATAAAAIAQTVKPCATPRTRRAGWALPGSWHLVSDKLTPQHVYIERQSALLSRVHATNAFLQRGRPAGRPSPRGRVDRNLPACTRQGA